MTTSAMMFEQSDDHKPVMWLGGYPVYATHFIVIVYVVTMIVATVLGDGLTNSLAQYLAFNSHLVHQGQIWRVFTYGLINPPSIPFVIDMVLLVWFGFELEKFFGRRVFLRFYAALYLLSPVLFTLLGFIRPMALVGETGNFAIFIAFATLYPDAVLIFRILAKWFAAVAVAIYTLMGIHDRDGIGLISLWAGVIFAFAFVRYEQGRLQLPKIRIPSFRKRPKLRVLPNPIPRAEQVDVDEDNEVTAEVDALLDKIAKSGIGSLTAKERERLEKAREELMKKESPRR